MKGVFNASVFMGRPLYPADITTVVSVYNAETNELVPTLWLDRDGIEELANPHPLSEDGVILFYADPGRYNIVVEKGTMLYREWPDVIISDAATSGTPGIQSIVAGTNVTVDDTDPLNPVVSATGGGGGATDFTDLGDVPSSYAGQAGKAVRVNSAANALEFYAPADAGVVVNVTSSGGHVTFDASQGKLFTFGLSENVTLMQIVNALPGDTVGIRITQDSTPRTVQWPANWFFTESSPITDVPTGAGHDAFLVLTTFDGGLDWYATMDKFQ